ncbi:hypothetical protein [Enterococcus sp. AZ163]|uniref:hypothetical protein n=1 Tax=Enterococcus sp. AZ163 TaxID=2774638 RepID=UPI003D2AFB85
MVERQSSLFPRKRRSSSSNLQKTKEFADQLERKKQETQSSPDEESKTLPIKSVESSESISKKRDRDVKETSTLKNPNKSHKGVAGRKAEYSDPRLKKDRNAKISLSTKVRIERLISRKYDGKTVGDIIDMALDNLVSTFDRDDRDSLFEAYKEDMELLKPIVIAENEKLKAAGKRFIELTDEVDKDTLKEQKNTWVNSKFD